MKELDLPESRMDQFYEKLLRPLLFQLDAEPAHDLGIGLLRVGLAAKTTRQFAARKCRVSPFGRLERFGLLFDNPIGVAAGFDKNARAVNQLAALGFGFVEVGTVTPKPQAGNEKPRMFRLPADGAILNRLGFNNDGSQVVARRLKLLIPECVVGVNVGKNKDVPNELAADDYAAAFEALHPVADYLSVNVSSPNTPGLRDLQNVDELSSILAAVGERNEKLGTKPLLVKIAPDLADDQVDEVTDLCLRSGVAGIIATNTTIGRRGLKTPNVEALGSGGISGRPLARRSTEVISRIYRRTSGAFPIVGVGGVMNAEDAFEKVAAGASLLQSYTGFVYGGPGYARAINLGLAELLTQRGFATLDEAVGFSHR